MTQMLPQKKEQEVEFIPFGTKAKIKLSLNIIKKLIAVPGKNGEEPDDRQCMRFMMLCRSRELDPFQGDAFMIPFFSTANNRYEWSLVTAHQAFLKRAEVHPDYNGKESGIIVTQQPCTACAETGQVKDQICLRCNGRGFWDEMEGDFLPEGVDLLGGWCRVYYKSKSKPEYQRLKLSTYRKKTPQWNDDPCGMICKCAEAAALRAAFPSALGGMMLREEMHGQEAGFATPEFEKPAEPEVTVQPEPSTESTTDGKSNPPQANLKHVAGLRKDVKSSGATEAEVLQHLADAAIADQKYETLEELAISCPEAFQYMLLNSGKVLDAINQTL